jgi:hypothetical protein
MPEKPSNFNEFDAAVVGQALGAEPRTMRDIAHGDGEALKVGDTVLEVYRDAGFARVTTADARIELFRVPSYTLSGERVVFEQGDQDDRSRLLVRSDGKVSFYPVLRATESSRTPDTGLSGRMDSPAPPVSSDSVTGRNGTTSGPLEAEKGGEVQQVQLQGRLGRDPWFSTSDEQHVAGFPLAVNDQEGRTTWHKVVVFDTTAEQLHEAVQKKQISKGKLVAVTGQTVLREEPKSNGGMKKSAEFHATDVTRVQATRSRPTR